MYYFFYFLFILSLVKAPTDDPDNYEAYIIKLGDPWRVTCETPYNDPTEWWFESALLYFDNYLYRNRFVNMMEDRYRMTKLQRPHLYTLIVSQTDKYHAGLYQCRHKNGKSEEGRRYYRLTLVDKSNIELLAIGNSIKMIMKIFYVGNEQPIFQCTFHYGDIIMNERTCIDDLKELFTCNLELIYGTDDDPPLSCQIRFESSKRLWNNTKLSIVQNSFASYVKEGEPYSVSCDTASKTSMSWYFNGVLPPTNESLLFSSWTVQPSHHYKYNFTYSNDRKTFYMMIAPVDRKHAGTYECTHKSTRHLIAKQIELVVIEHHATKLSNNNPATLIMSTSYVGHNVPTPLFKCISNNKWTTMSNMKCHVNEHGSTECHLNETLVGDVPDDCQIWFEDYLLKKFAPENEEHLKSSDSTIISSKMAIIIITMLIVFFLIIILLIIFIICKWKKKKLKKMNEDELENLLGEDGMEGARTILIRHMNDEPLKKSDVMSLDWSSTFKDCKYGYIEEYDYWGSCTITFSTHEKASLFKSKFFGSLSYELNWCKTWPVRNGCRGMEIKIHGDGIEESDIRSCLEDEKYGGVKDSIEDVFSKDERTVVVVFKDASALQKMSINSDLELQNTTLHLKVMKPLMPPFYVPSNIIDRKKLWFMNIHPKCYGDETKLRSFIENISQSEIDYFIFFDNDDYVCVSMKTIPDYSRIMMETCTRPFNGHMIKVQIMRQTLQIQIATANPMSKDDVKSYFSDNKKSGGDPVSKIEFKSKHFNSDNLATHFIMKYEKYEDVDNVSRRLHEIDGIKCCATPYYGDVYVNNAWKDDLPHGFNPTQSLISWAK